MVEDEDRHGLEGWLGDVVSSLREPLTRRPGAVDEVVRAATGAARAGMSRQVDRTGTGSSGRGGVRTWLTRPRLTFSPISAAGWSVAVAVLTLLLARVPAGPEVHPSAEIETASNMVRHQFVLVAPDARSVSLVGDFNDWDVDATPLTRRDGVWTVEVPLEAGRHVYSFVVDGYEWVADHDEPRAPDDDFGRPSSVVMVAGRGT